MDVDGPSPESEKLGSTRPREDEDLPTAKKAKLAPEKDETENLVIDGKVIEANVKKLQETSGPPAYILEDLLPPSRSLLPSSKLVERPADQPNLTFEADVGITEYVSTGVPPIQGIIKQRRALLSC